MREVRYYQSPLILHPHHRIQRRHASRVLPWSVRGGAFMVHLDWHGWRSLMTKRDSKRPGSRILDMLRDGRRIRQRPDALAGIHPAT